jgi:hypothetical protein
MRKLLAVPFGLVFVLLLGTTITLLSLRSFALDPLFYTSTLKQQGVFQAFEQDPLKFVDLNSQFSQLDALPKETQRRVIIAALPTGWLAQEMANALGSLFDWLKSDQSSSPTVALDLRPIKDRLQGPPGQAIASDLVAAIPTCAPDYQPNISLDRLPECIPAAFERSYIIEQVAKVLDDAAGKLQSRLDVGSQLVDDVQNMGTIHRAAQWLSSDVIVWVLALIALVIWLMGALIGGRNSKERWTWLGGWLMFGSFVALALVGLVFIGGTRAVMSSSITTSGAFTAAAVDVLRNLGVVFIQQFALRSLIPVAVLLIVSAMLIGVGLSRRQH